MDKLLGSRKFVFKRYVYLLIILIILAILFYSVSRYTPDHKNILVVKVIDGDTIKLENSQRVRLIGIDTPEYHRSKKLFRDSYRLKKDAKTIQKMGRIAYLYTQKLLERQHVRLEFDVEKYDKYDRLLAYVFLDDGTFVNAKIIEDGYATAYTVPPNVKYAQQFLEIQKQARENKRGLWVED